MYQARLEERVGLVDVHGVARIPDYVHRFTKPGADGTAKGNIELQPGARVLGVVYQLTELQIEQLAIHEGGYRQIEITSMLSEVSQAAFTFVAQQPSPQVVGPTDHYLEYYRRGIEQHGIGLDYYESLIAELRSR